MKKEISFVPVGKVLNVINSCETEDQMSNCSKIIDNYVEMISNKGVVNPKDVKDRLQRELKQKKFSIMMLKELLKQEIHEVKRKNIKFDLGQDENDRIKKYVMY